MKTLFIIISIVLFSWSITSAQSTGSVAEFNFNEGSGTTLIDQSGNGNNGTLQNSPFWSTTGKNGGALDFDGVNDRVDLGNLDIAGSALTLSAWVNWSAFTTSDARIISKTTGTAEADHYFMLSTIDSGGMKLRARLKTNGTTHTLIAPSSGLTANTWTHVALVYNGSSMTIYQNGVVVGSMTKTGTLSTNSSVPVALGSNPQGYGVLDGLLDDVRIYNRALTQTEIQTDMNTPVGGTTTTPPPPPPFSTGDRVQTTQAVSVRSTGSQTGTIVGTQPQGAQGVAVSVVYEAGGSTWWNVNFDSGVDGWVVQTELTTASVTPPPPPPSSSTYTRVFYDGFESGNTNLWASNNNGPAVVSTTQPKSGNYAAKGGWDGVVAWNDPRALEGLSLRSWPYTQEFLARFWIRLDPDVDFKPGAKYFRLPFTNDKQGNEIVWADLTGDHSFSSFAQVNSNAFTGWGCGSLSDNAWHKVEIYIKDSTSGAIRMWLDDQELTCGNSSGFSFPFYGNTRLNTAGWDNFYWPSNWSTNPGWEHDANNHIYLDEVEIFSDSTSGTPMTGNLSDGTAVASSGTTPPPPPPSSTKFSLNDRVQVSVGSGSTLNVRSTANGTLLGTQADGALGTVIGGPVNAGGYNWWQINYDSGVDGWSVEDYLTKYTAPPPPSVTPLSNSVPVSNIALSQGQSRFFSIDIPAGSTNLQITTSGGTGDQDLYVKFGSQPSASSNDFKSEGGTNSESITITSPLSGTYYITSYAYATVSGLTLTASYTASSPTPPPPSSGTPSISSTSGTMTSGASVTINGANFGTHANNNDSSLTWRGLSFLNARFKDFGDNTIQSNGFTLGFTDSFDLQTSGSRTNGGTYGRATYGSAEERVWFSTTPSGAPTGSGTFFTSFWFKMPANTQAGKFYRHYLGPESGRDNFYLSTGCGSYNIRGASEAGGSTEWGAGSPFVSNVWSRVDILTQAANGSMTVTVWKDGVQQWSHNNWGTNLSYSPNGRTMDFPNMVDAVGSSRCPENPSANGSYNYDDIYIDYTQARVELGNASTWTSSTIREIQLPSSWSSSSVTFTANPGSFSSGTTAYLYVVDQNGNVNANGYPVTIGSGSVTPPPAPSPTPSPTPAPTPSPTPPPPPPGGSVSPGNLQYLPAGQFQTLRIGISEQPGDISASTETNRILLGGGVQGYCGNSNAAPCLTGNLADPLCVQNHSALLGEMVIRLRAGGGPPGPGECVITPGIDHYVNILTLLRQYTGQSPDEYSIMISSGRLQAVPPIPPPRTPSGTVTPPSPTPTPTPPSPPPAFSANQRVQTTESLNVRANPSTSATLLGTQPVGASGVVVAGPIVADGRTWWNIDFDTGADGWVIQDGLSSPSSSGIFFEEGWESGTLTQTFNSSSYGRLGSQYRVTNTTRASGSYGLEHQIPAGVSFGNVQYGTQHFGDAPSGPVWPTGAGNHYNDIYVQYRVRYSAGYEALSPKQLIIGTQDDQRHDNACCNPWVANYITTNAYNGVFGTEANNKQGATGQWIGLWPNVGGYSSSNPYRVEPDRWYTIEVRRRLNDMGSDNGIFTQWIDGQMVSNYTNVRYRTAWNGTFGTSPNYGTNFVMISDWSEPSSSNELIHYDDIRMSTSYIGTSPSPTPTPTPTPPPPPPSSGTPSISSTSGTWTNGSTVTINGSGFGSTGPTIQIFDDFESGSTGATISPTGPRVGSYSVVNPGTGSSPSYSANFSKSGSRSMRIDAINGALVDSNSLTKTFSPNNNFFASWWQYVPNGQNIPGTSQSLPNWKLFWVGDTSHGWPYWADYVDVILANNFGSQQWIKADDTGNGPLTSCGYHSTLGANGRWVRFTYYMRGATSGGIMWGQQLDGSSQIVICNGSNYVTSRTGATWNWFQLPGYMRGGDSTQVYYDDYYLATGNGARARVEIGNASTYTNSSNLSLLTPTSWSDTSIAATVRQGSFSSGTAYLYVVDQNGNVNANGYPVTIGSGL